MKFEFDPNKSASNKVKHGIDFIDAQELWQGPVLEVPVATSDERRWLVIGKIGDVFWTAVIARRAQDSTRIISVRRSRDEEKELYEK